MGSSGGGSGTTVVQSEPAVVAAVQQDISGSHTNQRINDQQKQRARLRGIRSTYAEQSGNTQASKSALGA